MHLWRISFLEGGCGYVEADDALRAAEQVLVQDWDEDLAFVTSIELVENGFGPDVKHGWYSKEPLIHNKDLRVGVDL